MFYDVKVSFADYPEGNYDAYMDEEKVITNFPFLKKLLQKNPDFYSLDLVMGTTRIKIIAKEEE